MSSKTGTLFHCPHSDLLGDSGRVEWEVYEKVDLTEQEYRGIRQGPYLSSCVLAFNKHTQTSHYFRFGSGGIMHGVPADAREDHIWIKKSGTRKQFSQHMLSKIPSIFEHHQIELVSVPFIFHHSLCVAVFISLSAPPPSKAQRDGHKIVIQLIGPDSFVLLLHMDYAENYSHIQQIMSQQKWFKRLGQWS